MSVNNELFEEAKRMVASGEYACVVIRDNMISDQMEGKGIVPVLLLFEGRRLKDAVVVDKIVGKASAMIFALGGVTEVYGEVMSMPALAFLAQAGIKATCGQFVNAIENREGTGTCPMEMAVMDIDNAEEAYPALKAKIAELKEKAEKEQKAASETTTQPEETTDEEDVELEYCWYCGKQIPAGQEECPSCADLL
ncbi:MAG: DUF1893 domain-containing protein [Eubacteriaceae bacterium]|jgi:hypothetical protein|nr:DUF1893 domain-containing protein [Eubacteriaceae bacterium]